MSGNRDGRGEKKASRHNYCAGSLGVCFLFCYVNIAKKYYSKAFQPCLGIDGVNF